MHVAVFFHHELRPWRRSAPPPHHDAICPRATSTHSDSLCAAPPQSVKNMSYDQHVNGIFAFDTELREVWRVALRTCILSLSLSHLRGIHAEAIRGLAAARRVSSPGRPRPPTPPPRRWAPPSPVRTAR